MKLAGKPYERHLLAVIFIYILGFIIYLNTFSVPFVFDDHPNIRDNPSIRIIAIDVDGIRTAALDSYASRRPIANVSFALNYLVGGYDVKGYHLVNILIHIVNGVLVYFLTLILLRRNRKIVAHYRATDETIRLVALLAAALFIAHPVQTQAVTYIVQRMSSMATMFSLSSLLLYLLGRQRDSALQRLAFWSAGLVTWLLALGSKEIAATLPAIIVLVELLFYRDSNARGRGIVAGTLGFAILASAGVVVLYLGMDPAATIIDQYGARDFSPLERILTELRVLVFYISLLLFPYPDRLSIDHAFGVSRSLFEPISTLLAAVVIVALLALAVRSARRHPVPSFCILWFFVTLSIESSFIGLELVFEHRLYMPMFAFALAAAYLVSLVPPGQGSRAALTTGLLVVALAAGSIIRNAVWQDSVALWTDAVSKNPSGYRARNNLGRALADRGEIDAAVQQFKEAIALRHDFAEPHNNLGVLYSRTGRSEKALEHLETAIKLNPRYVQAYNNLGVTLLGQGDSYEAAVMLAQAVHLAPHYAKAHANLAQALARLGKPSEACRHLVTAIELDSTVSHSNAGLESCRHDSNTR